MSRIGPPVELQHKQDLSKDLDSSLLFQKSTNQICSECRVLYPFITCTTNPWDCVLPGLEVLERVGILSQDVDLGDVLYYWSENPVSSLLLSTLFL